MTEGKIRNEAVAQSLTWSEMVKYLDGTYASLGYFYEEQGGASGFYRVVTETFGKVHLECFINRDGSEAADVSDFETNYKNLAPRSGLLSVDGETVPTNKYGPLVHGVDLTGVARYATVIVDTEDSKQRLAIEGKVSVTAPEPPPTSGGRILIFADNPEVVPGNQDRDTVYTITDNKRLYIQQVIVGAEGDPTESGSTVYLYYTPDGGTTLLLIQKFFVQGDSYTVTFPNLSSARDGSNVDGVATNQGQLIVRRTRQGGGNQEVDATVIAYEDTP